MSILDEGKLLAAIVRGGAFMQEVLERSLEESGLSPLQVELMRLLAAGEASSQAAIARKLGVQRQSLTVPFRQLESAELIWATPSKEDRRALEWTVTDEGAHRLCGALTAIADDERRYLHAIGEDARAQIITALEQGIEAVHYEERMSWWPVAVAMRR